MHDIFMLGFDAREMGVRWNRKWDKGEKDTFLYRRDVENPFSIDTAVWPSVFDKYPELFPAHIGLDMIMWEELSRLEECLDKNKTLFDRFYIVSFALMRDACNKDETVAFDGFLAFLNAGDPSRGARTSGQPPGIADPAVVAPGWVFLGYDVATTGPISALSNCGFSTDTKEEYVERAKAQWGPKLNKFHLFNEYFHAKEFKNYSNIEVPEHAPFFVYGIWLIREVLGVKKPTSSDQSTTGGKN